MQALARRTMLRVPRDARSCAFLTKLKTMEADATKMMPTLPEDLQGIAAQGVRNPGAFFILCPIFSLFSSLTRIRAAGPSLAAAGRECFSSPHGHPSDPRLCSLSLCPQATISAQAESFAKERPELYKAVLAKIAEADAPGIRPTVNELKGPRPRPSCRRSSPAHPGSPRHGSFLPLTCCTHAPCSRSRSQTPRPASTPRRAPWCTI